MANLLTRLLRRQPPEASRSYGIEQYIRQITAQGGLMGPLYPSAVSYVRGQITERVENSFSGYVYGGYKVNSIVYGCMTRRSSVFTEARFMWRHIKDGQPGDLFHDDGLALLERPWPNGTTGELLARMIQDIDLAGNAYIVNEGDRLRRLRPDWVQIVLSGNPIEDPEVDVLGYVYTPGGPDRGEGVAFKPDELCHWSPAPDPTAQYRGQSWLTPVVREIEADLAATQHKSSFFSNGATLGPIIKAPEGMGIDKFREFVEASEAAHRGPDKAYATMYLAGGTDVTLSAATMQQLDFKATQGAGETRICVAAGVPATIAGVSEGLQGSSLNAGNFQATRRLFAEVTMRPLWRSVCAALSTILDVPADAELWFDEAGIAFLREDQNDVAQIQSVQATAINQHITAGFEPESARDAVLKNNLALLKPTGMVSVQLAPPGETPGGGPTEGGPDGAGQPADSAPPDDGMRAIGNIWEAELVDDDIERRYNRGQLRAPNGRWIDMGLLKKVSEELRKSVKGSSTTVDWRGVHVTAPVGGRDVTVNLSHLDIATIALLAVPGPDIAAGSYQAARALMIVRHIKKALAAAQLAGGVKNAVTAKRRGERPARVAISARRSDDLDLGRGHPYPGQKFKHGWIPVGLTSLGRNFDDRFAAASAGEKALVATAYQPSSPHVREALDLYGGEGPNSYTYVNDGLRGGGLFGVNEHNDTQRRVIAGLDEAMRESPGAPEDLAVYRVATARMFGLTDEQYRGNTDASLVGVKFRDKGFVSTSVDSRGYNDTGSIGMRILVPKGTKALSYTRPPNEDFANGLDADEVLLNRGLTFQVVADSGFPVGAFSGKPDVYGRRTIDVVVTG